MRGYDTPMNHPVARYGVLSAGVLACMLAVVPALPYVQSARGVAGPAAMDAVRPLPAALATAVAALACCAIACAVGKLINAAVGLFALGCGIAVIAARSGTIVDAAFDGDALLPLALQTLAWSVAVGAMSAAVFRVSGPLPDVPARDPRGSFAAEAFDRDAVRAMAAGLLAVAATWLVARTEMKGQAIGAAFVGGVATAMAARRMLGGAQPILLAAAPVAAVGLAQLFSALTFKGALDVAVAQRAVPGWSMAMPVDVAAGALLGIPVGLGWSKPSDPAD